VEKNGTFFNELPDGQAEKARQFKELFPNGLPEQKPYDFSALVQIINKSSNTDVQTLLSNPLDTTSALGQAIKAFREDFTATSMKETFFNPQHLIEAFNVYVQQYNLWDVNQLRLFWSQVIGYIQRFLPSCYAQAFCQGLYDVAENKKPHGRSLKFENDSQLYFPLADSSGLGFDFGIYSYCLAGRVAAPERAIARLLKKYVEQIQQNYLDLSAACSVSDSPLRTVTP